MLLEARTLVKTFGPVRAVEGVSFSVAAGEVVALLGPNGAGKSTTMKMLTGFLRPTSGEALIGGVDINVAPLAAKRRLGYLPEGAPAYGEMTPRRFLEFVGRARGLDAKAMAAGFDRAVAAMGLDLVLDRPVDTLSKGFRRRVGVAQAILHDPEVLILDEPTDGLDPNQKHEVRQLIAAMARDKAILISTHLLEEVEALCQRAIIIDHGRVVAEGTPAALRRRSRSHGAVRLTGLGPEAAAAFTGLPAIAATEFRDGALLIFARDGLPILEAVMAVLSDRDWRPAEISVDPGRLDEVFRTLTTGDREAA